MLIDFKTTNYRSFKNEQYFSMENGKRLSKYKDTNTINIKNEKLLKSSLIFGANANGKTNLIKALLAMKNLVVNPTSDELQELPRDSFGYNSRNTIFDITFIQKGNKYNYVIEYNSRSIAKELLTVDGYNVFKRIKQEFINVPDQLSKFTDNVRSNQLFLYYAQQNNENNSKMAYKWFAENLVFVNTEQIQNAKFKMLKNGKFRENFLHFLQAADFNIIDVDIRERPADESFKSILKKLNMDDSDLDDLSTSPFYDIYCTHKSEKGKFLVHFNNESTGTKVFMILAIYILSNSQKTLIIDEFDRSYHLELAQALLGLINSKLQTNQFILTTHQLSLMNYKLRQDQIWFAEKNEYGESELFSLFDFNDPALKRHDANYKKRYLEGLYGATQIVNKKMLLEVLEDSGKTEKKNKN